MTSYQTWPRVRSFLCTLNAAEFFFPATFSFLRPPSAPLPVDMTPRRSLALAITLLLCMVLQLVEGAAIPVLPKTETAAMTPSSHRAQHAQGQGLLGLLTHVLPTSTVSMSSHSSDELKSGYVAPVAVVANDMEELSGEHKESNLRWRMSTDDSNEVQTSKKRSRRVRHHP